ncbi:MAG: endonuclease [Candidatus Omnitrophica bacterium CG11_big_fil_rev_8_21_14_0_20_42_13]|uniref:Endonuclease n=1 Tax=Candidatus Ghiorseimicrobium undicola TaxID=1974746 RepID=A0A2H0LVX4_9BACT|nr:MAG: endonuclease [Candidatus Omnitrophica bacterium CG11_big_fil_rev_8_21_14_0_20_42_13]
MNKKKRLNEIYKRLFSYFGRQYWWPGNSKFEIVLGAILTQNTNWINVEKAINNLKKGKALSAKKVFDMPIDKLALMIKPAGYFNLKAKRLKNFINLLFAEYAGRLSALFNQDLTALRQSLLSVNGIGEETADSIILYAAGLPVFVVDAYTKRVFSRHKFIAHSASYAETQKFFMENLSGNVRMFNEFHALIVRLGKEFCLKNKPRCGLCPIRRKV